MIPAVVLTEVRKVVLKQRNQNEAEAVTEAMSSGIIIPANTEISTLAADLFIKHKLPLADSIIYATALIHNATLWTQDDDFKGLPKVKYYPKKKS